MQIMPRNKDNKEYELKFQFFQQSMGVAKAQKQIQTLPPRFNRTAPAFTESATYGTVCYSAH